MLKGQVSSIDAIIALGVFLMIFAVIGSNWQEVLEKNANAKQFYPINSIARNAMASLIETSGNPSNWTQFPASSFNETNVKSLGLGKAPKTTAEVNKERSFGLGFANAWQLDYNKVKKLAEFNQTRYDSIKKMLGITGPNYEYYLKVQKWNGTAYSLNTTIGSAPFSNASHSASIKRLAAMDGNWSLIELIVWNYG